MRIRKIAEYKPAEEKTRKICRREKNKQKIEYLHSIEKTNKQKKIAKRKQQKEVKASRREPKKLAEENTKKIVENTRKLQKRI